MDLNESALSFMRNFDKNSAKAASYQQIKKALDDAGFKDIAELIDEYEQVKKQLAESQRRERAAVESIETALELIEQEDKKHRGKTTNIHFHGGVIYALGYARGVLPDLKKFGHDPQEYEKGDAEAIAAWNRRKPENEPLTLEELIQRCTPKAAELLKRGLFGAVKVCAVDETIQKTNADRIRGMSDTELAEWICGVYDDDESAGKFINGILIERYDEDIMLDWLR